MPAAVSACATCPAKNVALARLTDGRHICESCWKEMTMFAADGVVPFVPQVSRENSKKRARRRVSAPPPSAAWDSGISWLPEEVREGRRRIEAVAPQAKKDAAAVDSWLQGRSAELERLGIRVWSAQKRAGCGFIVRDISSAAAGG